MWTIKKGASKDVKFEIEGIGFPIKSSDNRLWFHANEADSSGVREDGGIFTDSQNIK